MMEFSSRNSVSAMMACIRMFLEWGYTYTGFWQITVERARERERERERKGKRGREGGGERKRESLKHYSHEYNKSLTVEVVGIQEDVSTAVLARINVATSH